MEPTPKYEPIQPRFLRYRNHYKIYGLAFVVFSTFIAAYWCFQMMHYSWSHIWGEQKLEFIFSIASFFGFVSLYFLWLKNHFQKSIQVFPTHLLIHDGKSIKQLDFTDVESVSQVCWSLFYLKSRSGIKYYFNSSIDRLDYIWEGLMMARPDLMKQEEFESYRLKLVQYDHHQKRKDWFFRHKMLDVFNWVVLPLFLVMAAHMFQSKDVLIYQQGMYLFRLVMFTLLILLVTSFFYSMVLKKFVFDRKIASQLHSNGSEKFRDLEFEGVILQRSKIFQIFTAIFIFAITIHHDLNFYSVTKLKEGVASFHLQKGHTIVVDNRYNCTKCRYQINDGDLIVFGRGYLGQIMAKEGEFVGEVAQDKTGRTIASDNVQEVPPGHVAVRSSNEKDIIFVKMSEITGKIRN